MQLQSQSDWTLICWTLPGEIQDTYSQQELLGLLAAGRLRRCGHCVRDLVRLREELAQKSLGRRHEAAVWSTKGGAEP